MMHRPTDRVRGWRGGGVAGWRRAGKGVQPLERLAQQLQLLLPPRAAVLPLQELQPAAGAVPQQGEVLDRRQRRGVERRKQKSAPAVAGGGGLAVYGV